MKLSEITGDRAFEVLEALIDPISVLAKDKELLDKLMKEKDIKGAVKKLLKEHRQTIIEVYAILEGVEPKEYKYNVLTFPIKLVQLLNDPELLQLFSSAEVMRDAISSSSASENIGE